MAKTHNQAGFTLVEVMTVVIILAVIAAIAVPRLTSSTDRAREQADISTGRQIKNAFDRYQVEHGIYPQFTQLQAEEGEVIDSGGIFIGQYISKLNPSVTQQRIGTRPVGGFGIATLPGSAVYPDPTRLIMIYLASNGAAVEVRVYDSELEHLLWSSTDD